MDGLPSKFSELSDYEQDVLTATLSKEQIIALLGVLSVEDVKKLELQSVTRVIKSTTAQTIAKLNFEVLDALHQDGFPDYEGAIPLDIALSSSAKSIKGAVTAILDKMGNISGNAQRNSEALNTIVCNLLVAHAKHPSQFLYYFRGRDRYTKIQRYNPLGIGRDPLVRVVDALEGLDLITHQNHYSDPASRMSRASRMRATEELIWLLQHTHKAHADDVTQHANGEIIVLKDADKWLVDYEDTDNTRAMRDALNAYNKLLSRSDIELNLQTKESKALREAHTVNFSLKSYHRVFNNGSFEEGGRFYGPWWQAIPSELRQFVTINGEPTVEMDFSAIQINMLYGLEGLDYKTVHGSEDPYMLEGYENRERPALKKAISTLFNASNERKAKRAISYHLKKDGLIQRKWDHKKFLTAFRKKHAVISKHIGTGIGLKLQYKDSKIAEYVIRRFTKRYIPVLCIHDGFVCEKDQRDELRKAMKKGYRKLGLSSLPNITEL